MTCQTGPWYESAAPAKADNNISVAARLPGLPRSTLRSKLDKS